MKTNLTVIFGSLAFMLLILISTPLNSFVKKEYSETSILDLYELAEEIEETIYKMNFRYPHIVLAQAKLESANFSSTIFIENNNLFGMKQARTRPTTATGTSRSHATYNSWKDSIIDYALYASTYLHGKSEYEYYAYLGRNYAQDPDYVNKLKHIVQTENLVFKYKR
jgi:hypothetical protein